MAFIPNAQIYGDRAAHALQAYQAALGNVKNQRQGVLQKYGFTSKPDGSGYQIDQNNPYGAVQMLKRGQAQQLNSAWDQSTERRIGHVGLGAQQESDLKFGHGEQTLGLGRSFNETLGGLAQQESGALANYNNELSAAQLAAINAGIYQEDFTPYAEPTPQSPSSFDNIKSTLNPAFRNLNFSPLSQTRTTQSRTSNNAAALAKKVTAARLKAGRM